MHRTSLQHLQRPKLRDDVQVSWGDGAVRLNDAAQDYELDIDVHDDHPTVKRVIGRLQQGGYPLDFLIESERTARSEVVRLLTQLDDLRMLVDSDYAIPSSIVNGTQLLRSIDLMESTIVSNRGESDFIRELRLGSVSRYQLIGFALEYYWFVRAAPSLIAPAISHAISFEERDVLTNFFRSELNHDRFLEKALAAVGIDRSQLHLLQPLPSTFGLATSLAVYAKQHLTTFRAVLRLFERPQPEFNQLLVEQARRVGLPAEFYRPIIQHASLNDEFDHGDISATLLSHVPVISAEEQRIVKCHYALMMETQMRQENEILHYYAGDGLNLRIFS